MPSAPANRRSYLESAQHIAAYVQRTGSLPASDGHSGSETDRLARALNVLRHQKRRGRLTDEAIQVLDAAFPAWSDGTTLKIERQWQARATEFIEWVTKNGRRPHHSSADPTERALSSWITRQRRHAAKGQYPARIQELNARMPGWDRTPGPRSSS
ncbi:helicase associated domain-containing protein [Paenarthrobacter sp. NPDC090517]|uniref:helicase associated domain-containing protein n=1 Tax=Paenarthrobacter sp. NPDC090517 TaxID=3364381 RepID=UPI00381469BA